MKHTASYSSIGYVRKNNIFFVQMNSTTSSTQNSIGLFVLCSGSAKVACAHVDNANVARANVDLTY
jgi:hypothetical protein